MKMEIQLLYDIRLWYLYRFCIYTIFHDAPVDAKYRREERKIDNREPREQNSRIATLAVLIGEFFKESIHRMSYVERRICRHVD